MASLKARMEEVSSGLARGWRVDLARRCKISAPSVSDWLNGKTKEIDRKHWDTVGEFFGVNPSWIGEGKGPKHLAMSGNQSANGELVSWPFSLPYDRYLELSANTRQKIDGFILGAAASEIASEKQSARAA